MKDTNVTLSCEVISGRGKAKTSLSDLVNIENEKLEIYPGSLNLVAKLPIRLDDSKAFFINKDGKRKFWKCQLNDVDAFIYRWPSCPLHIFEIVSLEKLRDRMELDDGDCVYLKVQFDNIDKLHWLEKFSWILLYFKREKWYYNKKNYFIFLSFPLISKIKNLAIQSKNIAKVPFLVINL